MLTEITDTLKRPNGAPFVGMLSISLNYPDRAQPLRNSDGDTLVGFRRDVTVTDGSISLSLEANDAITPAGTSYSVRYQPAAGNGTSYTETWIVPTSASPVKVYELRSTTVPLPSVLIPATQISGGVRTADVPGSATASGSVGMIAADSTYLYVCVAANTWRRVALSTF